tara:strand:- start:240290 stop:240409 length:120 start_codon:yes stop_codon:yes gene_type:complete
MKNQKKKLFFLQLKTPIKWGLGGILLVLRFCKVKKELFD